MVDGQTNPKLQPVVDATRSQLASQDSALRAESRFLDHLTALLDHECAKFRPHLDSVVAELQLYLTCASDLSEVQLRAIEDLNDVTERFVVVRRAAEERAATLDRLKAARGKLLRARAAMSAAPPQGLVAARVKVSQAIQRVTSQGRKVQEADRAFASARQRYDDFRIRRLRQSYEHLGAGLADIKQREVEVWGKVREAIARIQHACNVPTSEARAPDEGSEEVQTPAVDGGEVVALIQEPQAQPAPTPPSAPSPAKKYYYGENPFQDSDN
jgi:hypothetical protein